MEDGEPVLGIGSYGEKSDFVSADRDIHFEVPGRHDKPAMPTLREFDESAATLTELRYVLRDFIDDAYGMKLSTSTGYLQGTD